MQRQNITDGTSQSEQSANDTEVKLLFCRLVGLLHLFSEALSALQTVHDGLDEEAAATFTESTVVLTFLSGLGEQSHPNLGHRVSTGVLPEPREKMMITKQLAQMNLSQAGASRTF